MDGVALDDGSLSSNTQITVGLGTLAALAFAAGKWLFGGNAKALDELKHAQESQSKAILAKLDDVVTLQGTHTTALAVSERRVTQLEARLERLEEENQRNRDERHRVAQLQSDALLKLADAVRSLPVARER